MWQAIKSAAEALLANDVSLANAIVEVRCFMWFLDKSFIFSANYYQASNITTPNGSLEVCYDERGHQYKVPQYCVANPIELGQTQGTDTSNVLSLTTSATIIPTNIKKNPVSTSTNNAPMTIKLRINPG